MRLILIGSCFVAMSATALAYKPGPPQELTCPIDGTRFPGYGHGPAPERYDLEYLSNAYYLHYFDLKPLGRMGPGDPLPVPKCPSNGFVMYKRGFSASELARLRPYVSSKEYRSLANEEATYYLIARLRMHLGEKPAQLRYTLLQASWEARSPAQYSRYAAEALDAYNTALKSPYAQSREWTIDQLVAGELERRLGRFEDARARFSMLANRAETGHGWFRDVVSVQLALIAGRGTWPCVVHQPYRPESGVIPGGLPQFSCRERH